MTRNEYFQKLAYEVGHQAALEGMEKEAFLPVLRAAWGLGKGLFGGLTKNVTSGLGSMGTKLVGAVKGTGTSPFRTSLAKGMEIAGRGMAKDTVSFGLLGGGLGAAFNPEDRWGGFQRGFMSGALGGAAWRGAGNLARVGQFKAMKAISPQFANTMQTARMGKVFKPVAEMAEASKAHQLAGKGWFTDPGRFWNRANPGMMKRVGAKAALGTVPVGAAFYASGATPTFEPELSNPQQYGFGAQSGYGAQMPQQGYGASPYMYRGY